MTTSRPTVACACQPCTCAPAGSAAFEAELDAAEACRREGRDVEAFHHLERAHVLGQATTLEHVRIHVRMLRWGLRQGDAGEVLGQVSRIAGAACMTPLRLVPRGNTGGANVSAFRSMPIPSDLASLMEAAPQRDLRAFLAAASRSGESYGRAIAIV